MREYWRKRAQAREAREAIAALRAKQEKDACRRCHHDRDMHDVAGPCTIGGQDSLGEYSQCHCPEFVDQFEKPVISE